MNHRIAMENHVTILKVKLFKKEENVFIPIDKDEINIYF